MKKNLTMGEKIGDLLSDRGINSQKLSEDTGIPKATISEIISDKDKNFGYKTIIKIAKALNVSVDYLVGLESEPTNDKGKQFVCEYTGLSLQAVEKLYSLNEKHSTQKQIEIIDYMLADTFLSRFSFLISEILRYKKMLIIDKDINGKKIIELESELKEVKTKGQDTSLLEWDIKTRKNEDFEQKEFFNFKQWELLKEIESEISDLINDFENEINNLIKE